MTSETLILVTIRLIWILLLVTLLLLFESFTIEDLI